MNETPREITVSGTVQLGDLEIAVVGKSNQTATFPQAVSQPLELEMSDRVSIMFTSKPFVISFAQHCFSCW